MAIYDLFSKRQKRLRGEVPDVLAYDSFPEPLRVQVLTILDEALGTSYKGPSAEAWRFLRDTLKREYGMLTLSQGDSGRAQVHNFLLGTKETEKALDVVELGFRLVNTLGRSDAFAGDSKVKVGPDEAIAELNARFREHGVGYQFESGEVIRVDSTLLHAEVVKPTLQLLQDPLYAGANTEFLNAYEHYRHWPERGGAHRVPQGVRERAEGDLREAGLEL